MLYYVYLICGCVIAVLCAGCGNPKSVLVPVEEKNATAASVDTEIAVCSLSAQAMNTQIDGYRQSLADQIKDVRELEDGFQIALDYSTTNLEQVLELIRKESECCASMNFQLQVRPSDEQLSLILTGPPAVKQLISAVIPLSGNDR